jgi:HD-GYP domain-containing protein (c-di-GMP phosphodiesterase class II)
MDIVLDDPSVNRCHAEIFVQGQEWFVRGLGNGQDTSLNGVAVGRAAQRLRPDDVLRCGNLDLKVSVPEHISPASNQLGHVLLPGTNPISTHDIKTSGNFYKIQARAQHSWEHALEVAALGPEQRPGQGRRLLTLLRTGYHLCHSASVDELLQAILADAVAVVNAQRGSLLLAEEKTGQLHLLAVSVPRGTLKAGSNYSKTLAVRCFQQGESLLCHDVSTDADLAAANSVLHGAMASIICALLRSPRRRLGVLHLDRGPLQEPFSEDDFRLVDAIAASVSVGIESAQLVEKQRNQFIDTVTALARTVELRDQYTSGHTQRVTSYSLMLAEELGLSTAERQQIRIGTPLHDIGKIGVEDAILRKPGKLTPAEFELMKQHTLKGVAILEPIPDLGPMLSIVRHHHERWDGTGYPDGLASERISPAARIVAVADAFDAMTSDRPYRLALSVEKAFAELLRHAGSHFDPACVEAFLRLRPRIEALLAQERSHLRTKMLG